MTVAVASNSEVLKYHPPLSDKVSGSAATEANTNGSDERLIKPSDVKNDSKPLGHIAGQPYFGSFSKQYLTAKYGSNQTQANGSSTDTKEPAGFTSFISDLKKKEQATDIKKEKLTPEEIRSKEQSAILEKITDPLEKAAIKEIMVQSNLVQLAFNERMDKNVEQLQEAKIAQETWRQFVSRKTMLEELGVVKSRGQALSVGR